MHEHTEPKKCKHEIKYCTHCDTVYCEKCKDEWKKQQFPTVYVGDTLSKEQKWNSPWATYCMHQDNTYEKL